MQLKRLWFISRKQKVDVDSKMGDDGAPGR